MGIVRLARLSNRRNRLPASYGSRLPMHDSCAFHAGLESPVKMISMRRIWAQRPNLVSNSPPIRSSEPVEWACCLFGSRIARSPSCVRQDPSSRPTNWQFFGNAPSCNWLPLIRPMMRPAERIGIFSSQRAIQFSVQSVMPAASRITPPRSVYDERGLIVPHCTSRSYSAETSRPV
jgi:hypothetical protein